MVFACGTCWKEFPAGYNARENHCNATGHRRPRFECPDCDLYFNNTDGVNKHYDDQHAVVNCRYWHCFQVWEGIEGRDRHERDDHLFCADCDREFQNENNLRMHLNSYKHRGNSIACPLCKAGFTTTTGLTHHLERGACPRAPSLDRDAVYNIVRTKDPKGLISKNLIEYHGSTQYQATERSWNGYNYECPMCPGREFRQLHHLNQHLSSPAHQTKLYHCPKPACRREFTTLAAIVNHLESESCGAMTFDKVQKSFSNVISGNRRITM